MYHCMYSTTPLCLGIRFNMHCYVMTMILGMFLTSLDAQSILFWFIHACCLQAPMGFLNPFALVNLLVVIICAVTFWAIVGVLVRRKLI